MSSMLRAVDSLPVAIGPTADVLGENPVWDSRRDALYWVDIRARLCRRMDGRTMQVDSVELPELSPGVALAHDDRVVVAQRSHLVVLDFKRDAIEDLAWPSPSLAPEMRFNEMKADPLGRAWLGFMDDAKKPNRGGLLRLDADESSTTVSNVTVPNGICWSPDHRTMYFADSAVGVVWAFDFDTADGSISNRREFVRVPPISGVPDGATVDSDGHVWIAHYGGGRVVRYAPDGSIDRELRVPASQPTACAFGGPDLDVLFITTASQRLTAAERRAEPLAGRLLAARPGFTGCDEPRLQISSTTPPGTQGPQ